MEYTLEEQKIFIEFLLNDPDLFTRCNSIMSENYFASELKPVVKYIRNYADSYSTLPDRSQLEAKFNERFENMGVETYKHEDWFFEEFENFCRHMALEKAIIKSYDILESKQYGEVERLIKDAVQIGLPKELGTDYWADPEGRLKGMLEQNAKVSTGWKSVDDILFEGVDIGSLNIFAGSSGAGKSLFLQNLALNWAEAGYNVLYVSLELSETLCCMRLDSMLTGYGTRDIFKNLADVATKVAFKGKKYGQLQVVQLPNGINTNDLKAYLKEYQIQNKIKLNAILVDYLDLMRPASKGLKISGDNVFEKDKEVSQDLRNLATEGNYLMATASQLNRTAVDELVFGHNHIAGGISKIQTADNVIAIYSSREMRENGKIQVQFIKCRNSNGEGRQLDLGFDPNCLRITDLPEDNNDEEAHVSKMYQKVKDRVERENSSTTPKATLDRERLNKILKRTE